jgi:hypothetical protein
MRFALNPRICPGAIGGTATITSAGRSTSRHIALTVFVTITSIAILVPVVGYVMFGAGRRRVMMSTKQLADPERPSYPSC